MYLLDTCFLSEIKKKSPAPSVMQFFDAIHPAQTFISVITLGELKTGIEWLEDIPRKRHLLDWLETVQRTLKNHILPIDQDVMQQWATTNVILRRQGQSVSAFDALIAATALHYQLQVVTRNVKHFAPTGVSICNPWLSENSQ